MKIKLDASEISAILINWAKQKYKTHNISAEFNGKEAEIEITMSTDQLTDGHDTLTDTAIMAARKRVFEGGGVEYFRTPADMQPDLTPTVDAFVTPLA